MTESWAGQGLTTADLYKEVEVSGAREHLPQEDGQEGDDVVLGRAHTVGHQALHLLPLVQLHHPRLRRAAGFAPPPQRPPPSLAFALAMIPVVLVHLQSLVCCYSVPMAVTTGRQSMYSITSYTDDDKALQRDMQSRTQGDVYFRHTC